MFTAIGIPQRSEDDLADLYQERRSSKMLHTLAVLRGCDAVHDTSNTATVVSNERDLLKVNNGFAPVPPFNDTLPARPAIDVLFNFITTLFSHTSHLASLPVSALILRLG